MSQAVHPSDATLVAANRSKTCGNSFAKSFFYLGHEFRAIEYQEMRVFPDQCLFVEACEHSHVSDYQYARLCQK